MICSEGTFKLLLVQLIDKNCITLDKPMDECIEILKKEGVKFKVEK